MAEGGIDFENKDLEVTRYNFWAHRQEVRKGMKDLEEQMLKHHDDNQTSFDLVGEDIDAIGASTGQIEVQLAACDARMERRSVALQDAILNINTQLNALKI